MANRFRGGGGVINPSKRAVRFRVRLDNKPHIERVELEAVYPDGSSICSLHHFNREVARFWASPEQGRKISAQKGILNVTTEMIDKASSRTRDRIAQIRRRP